VVGVLSHLVENGSGECMVGVPNLLAESSRWFQAPSGVVGV
jgi:hypothetical protein